MCEPAMKLVEPLRDEYRYRSYDVVEYCERPLVYPPDYPSRPAREKGVDVQLAVDFVSGALAGRFDVGIIMSTDTDLYPALEAVRSYGIDTSWPLAFPPELNLEDEGMERHFEVAERVDKATHPRCEVAAWRAPDGHSPCLRLPRPWKGPALLTIDLEAGKTSPHAPPPEPGMWCHWLDRADYDAVADLADYSGGDPPLVGA